MAQSPITVHTISGSVMPVNSYIVESESGVVVIDTTISVSDSTAVSEKVESLAKPLAGVIITHAHPDHYAGAHQIVADKDIPIIALSAVAEKIEQDDAEKDAIVAPMMGDEWPKERDFPTKRLQDGDSVSLAGLTFTVKGMGPSESLQDSIWSIKEDPDILFVGDIVYNHMHAYLADGYYQEWLENLDRLEDMVNENTKIYQGHGEPGDKSLIHWQRKYIETFVSSVKDNLNKSPEERKSEVTKAMKEYLASEDLWFLTELSIEPTVQKLMGK